MAKSSKWDQGALPPATDETYTRLLRQWQRALKVANRAVGRLELGDQQSIGAVRAVRVAAAHMDLLKCYVNLHEDWNDCSEACRASGHRTGAVSSNHAAS